MIHRAGQGPPDAVRPALWVALFAALIHAGALWNGFAGDDLTIIVSNERVHDLSRLWEAVSTPYWPIPFGEDMGLWRPVTVAAYSLQWSLWGDSAVGFHLVNILVHGAVSGAVVLLAAVFLPVAAAVAAGLLFSAHPVHVEAVANVVGLAELLSALLALTACIAWLGSGRGPADAPSGRGILTVCGLYAAAVLSKESAVTLPAVLLVLDGVRHRLGLRDLGPYLRARLPAFLLLGVTLALLVATRGVVLGGLRTPLPPVGGALLTEVPSVWTAAGVWTEAVRVLVFPLELAADYSPGRTPVRLGWDPVALAGVLAAGACLALAWRAWRAPRAGGHALTLGVLWFAITAFTVSNLYVVTGVFFAERTLYLPSVGFCLALVGLLLPWGRAQPARAAAVVVIACALLGARSAARVPTWNSTEDAFLPLVERDPGNGRMQWVLADLLWRSGDHPEARAAYARALGTLGQEYRLLCEISGRLLEAGHPASAELLARFAWQAQPRYEAAPGLLGMALIRQARYREALLPLAAARDANPADPAVHALLAIALDSVGRVADAEAARRRALEVGDHDP